MGSSLITSFGRRASIERRLPGFYDEKSGEWRAGKIEKRQAVIVSVQPADAEDVMRLPEGHRNKDVVRIFTAQRLQVSDESRRLNADIITIDGRRYELISEKDYVQVGPTMNIRYYRYIAVTQNEELKRGDREG